MRTPTRRSHPVRSPRTWWLLVLVALPVWTACSTVGQPSPGGTDVLTEADLAEMINFTCYDAVRRLRPMWLQSRAARAAPIVVIDGTPQGQVELLRSFRAIDFSEIRHLEGPEATMRYGTGFAGGALVLTSKRSTR